MKLLITGGAGFIGSHLAEELLGLGHSVQVLDDLSTGSLSNIAQLEGKDNFKFVRGSILDAELIRELIDEVDGCIHLAAALGVQ